MRVLDRESTPRAAARDLALQRLRPQRLPTSGSTSSVLNGFVEVERAALHRFDEFSKVLCAVMMTIAEIAEVPDGRGCWRVEDGEGADVEERLEVWEEQPERGSSPSSPPSMARAGGSPSVSRSTAQHRDRRLVVGDQHAGPFRLVIGGCFVPSSGGGRAAGGQGRRERGYRAPASLSISACPRAA